MTTDITAQAGKTKKMVLQMIGGGDGLCRRLLA